jgi:hypothetical protein
MVSDSAHTVQSQVLIKYTVSIFVWMEIQAYPMTGDINFKGNLEVLFPLGLDSERGEREK